METVVHLDEFDGRDDAGFPKISQPALRALHAAGYTRLSQLADVSDEELLTLHGMGPKALRILREALAQRGEGTTEK
jgi:hypothetical protein